MLMKQLQSQMEAEMRMKTELVRNQMQILSQVQSDSDFNEVISRFNAGIIPTLCLRTEVVFGLNMGFKLIEGLRKNCGLFRHFWTL